VKFDKHKEIFSEIYRSGTWGGRGIPRSGSGSLPSAARPYVQFLEKFLKINGVASVLDIGHGDWEMWESFQFESIKYIGLDIYDDITNQLSEKYGTENRQFIVRNAITNDLPKAQACISKDVLQHLPNADILKILGKMGDFEYVIICNDAYKFKFEHSLNAMRRFLSLRERAVRIRSHQKPWFLKLKRTNSDCQIGEHRPLNLKKRPFRKSMENFQLLKIVDFQGSLEVRPNIVKRIFVYSNNKESEKYDHE